jgi:hypothetical protein
MLEILRLILLVILEAPLLVLLFALLVLMCACVAVIMLVGWLLGFVKPKKWSIPFAR